ncbi:NACHT domain-containing protein [Massilia sp. W12]|uniref:NACHT domain-containing protein n=1 Tax=Massilia sp. W12 TaxID=3126507 RepID=UPI0030CB93F8
MNMRYEQELSKFADIDQPFHSQEEDGSYNFYFHLNGDDVKVGISKNDGFVSFRRGETAKKFSSYKGLLMSEDFCFLKKMAKTQELQYKDNEYTDMRIHGSCEEDIKSGEIFDYVENFLTGIKNPDVAGVKVLVIDGVAGVGKTHLINKLVNQRAKNFGPGCAPLILHVSSRGRRLTNLMDLVAWTLQNMRLNYTFDQVPILMRNGLLQLAIDGFDELADPNGYESAWGAIRDLINDVGDAGALILAGRDTFINADVVKKYVPKLDCDLTKSIHLMPLPVGEAIEWFQQEGWEKERIDHLISLGLLERESPALRPFFLIQLNLLKEKISGDLGNPIDILVNSLLKRECKILKTGDIDEGLFESGLLQFFMEIARDMSDNEIDYIDEGTLKLLCELVFSDYINQEDLRILSNKVKSLAFLEDGGDGLRKFPHGIFQNYFLAKSHIQILLSKEIAVPKSLRRNIFGAEFFEIFLIVLQRETVKNLNDFLRIALDFIKGRDFGDLSRSNIACMAAMIASVLSGSDALPEAVEIYGVNIAFLIFRGNVSKIRFSGVEISMLDIRNANIQNIVFNDQCTISSVLGNNSTVIPGSFPDVNVVSEDLYKDRFKTYYKNEALNWVSERKAVKDRVKMGEWESYFIRLCAIFSKEIWIREDKENILGRMLINEKKKWAKIKEILVKHELIEFRSDDKKAGGKKVYFCRIKKVGNFLLNDAGDEKVAMVLEEIKKMDL